MDPLTAMALINGFLNMGFGIWKTARQILGKDSIPDWDAIIADNKTLQDKIDAEKDPVVE